jgi:hypothetical protein
MPTKPTIFSNRSDFFGFVSSLTDACACLIFLFWQTNLTNVGRAAIECVVDPIACLVGYWAIYERLRNTRPVLSEVGFYFLVLGTFFVAWENGMEVFGNLNAFSLPSVRANEAHTLLQLLGSFTLPIGLAIYAWLIASSAPRRRWLGWMLGVEVVILYMVLGSFNIPWVGEFVTSRVLTVYAIILSIAKGIWFLSSSPSSNQAGLSI